MTMTRVRANQFVADNTTGTTVVFTTASSLGAGGAPAVGNLVVVAITTVSVTTMTPPAGSTWQLDRTIQSVVNSNLTIWIYSRKITGGEAATYTWDLGGSHQADAVSVEWNSTLGSNWAADTGASDPGASGNVTSRPIGTSAALASTEEAVIAVSMLSSSSAGYSVTGGPTFTEVNAGTKFDHYATAVSSGTGTLSLTGNWTTARAGDAQAFQTYQVIPLVTVSPAAVPMTLTEPAPTVTADGSPSAAAVPLVMAYPPPAPAASGSASPAAVPLVLSLPTPDILSGVPVPADALAMSLLLPAPGFVIDETASPGAVPMALAFPAPSILITVPVFPQPVPLAFSFPHPDVESRFGPVPVFALGRAPSTTPADRYPEPPYDPDRDAPPVQYRDGAVTYDPSP